MNKPSLTKGLVTLKDLQKEPRRLWLWNLALHLHHLGKVTAGAELGDDVAVVGRVEGVYVAEDVGVLHLPETVDLGLQHGFGCLVLE